MDSPDFGRHADDWVEHAVKVTVPEEAFHSDAIHRETDLGNCEIYTDSNDVTSLELLLSFPDNSRLSRCITGEKGAYIIASGIHVHLHKLRS